MTTNPVDPFDTPRAGTLFSAKDHVGQLVLVEATGHAENVVTASGVSDLIEGDVTVLHDNGAVERIENAAIFGKVLVSTLKGSVGTGRPVLGRIGQGVAKGGNSAPWVLDQPSDADKARARHYWTTRPDPFTIAVQQHAAAKAAAQPPVYQPPTAPPPATWTTPQPTIPAPTPPPSYPAADPNAGKVHVDGYGWVEPHIAEAIRNANAAR